jgi:hypothetical protein
MKKDHDLLSELFEQDEIYLRRRSEVLKDIHHRKLIQERAHQKHVSGLFDWMQKNLALASITGILILGSVGALAAEVLLPERFRPTNIFSTTATKENYKFTSRDFRDFSFTYPKMEVIVTTGEIIKSTLEGLDLTKNYSIKLKQQDAELLILPKELATEQVAQTQNASESLFVQTNEIPGYSYKYSIPFTTQYTGNSQNKKVELVSYLNENAKQDPVFTSILSSFSDNPQIVFGEFTSIKQSDYLQNGSNVTVLIYKDYIIATDTLNVRLIDTEGDLIGAGFCDTSTKKEIASGIQIDCKLQYNSTATQGTLVATIDTAQLLSSVKNRITTVVNIGVQPIASSSSVSSSTSFSASTQPTQVIPSGVSSSYTPVPTISTTQFTLLINNPNSTYGYIVTKFVNGQVDQYCFSTLCVFGKAPYESIGLSVVPYDTTKTIFSGWSGDVCSTTPKDTECSFGITQKTSVTANWTKLTPVSVYFIDYSKPFSTTPAFFSNLFYTDRKDIATFVMEQYFKDKTIFDSILTSNCSGKDWVLSTNGSIITMRFCRRLGEFSDAQGVTQTYNILTKNLTQFSNITEARFIQNTGVELCSNFNSNPSGSCESWKKW